MLHKYAIPLLLAKHEQQVIHQLMLMISVNRKYESSQNRKRFPLLFDPFLCLPLFVREIIPVTVCERSIRMKFEKCASLLRPTNINKRIVENMHVTKATVNFNTQI